MDTKDIYKIDYLILINKYHKVPETWEDDLRTVSFINPLGEEVIIEEKAYQAYLGLKKDLEKEGVFISLDGALRTHKRQEEIAEDFLEKYGPIMWRRLWPSRVIPNTTVVWRWICT